MSKPTFYQTDFKPDYQLFQQKISALQSQSKRIQKKQINLQKLQHQLQLIKEEIDDQGFEFDNSTIFLRYASIQQLAQKKKTASDCCCHCGEEMKKSVQCELCGEMYCKNCCWRKRVIPFEEHEDFRLCCQECHQKYIKHFNNQEFLKEKGVYLAAIDQLQRKYEKSKVKFEKKEAQVNAYKEQKRTNKIKQGNLKKSLLEQEKRIKQLTEQFQKAVQQKALQIKQKQQQKRKEELDKENLRIIQQKQKEQQEERKKRRQTEQNEKRLSQSRLKEEQLLRKEAQIKRQKEQIERQKKQLSESRAKQLEQIQREKARVSSVEPKTQQKLMTDNIQSIHPKPQPQVTRKFVLNEQLDFDSILSKASEPPKSQQQPQSSQPTLKDLLKEIKQTQKPQTQKPLDAQKSQKQTEKQRLEKDKVSEKSGSHNLQNHVNESPRITMNQIKTMSMNDLLSMKIPMNPSAQSTKKPRKSSHPDIKTDAQSSSTTQNQKMYQSLLQPGLIPQESSQVGFFLSSPIQQPNTETNLNYNTNYNNYAQTQEEKLNKSIHSVHEQQYEPSQEENKVHKMALLRKSSIISSVNRSESISKSNRQPEYNQADQVIGEQPQKCTCEIM